MRWTARGILWWMIQPHLENYWFCPRPNRRWWWHRGESITGQEAASGTQRANVCPFPFVITAVRATGGARECGIAARACPLQAQVEMGVSSINLKRRRKKRRAKRRFSTPASSRLRNLHVKCRQKQSKRKQSSCLSSVKIPSVLIWSSALPARSKRRWPHNQYVFRGSSVFVNKQAPLMTEHNALLQYSLGVAWASLCRVSNGNLIIKGWIVAFFIQTQESTFYEESF